MSSLICLTLRKQTFSECIISTHRCKFAQWLFTEQISGNCCFLRSLCYVFSRLHSFCTNWRLRYRTIQPFGEVINTFGSKAYPLQVCQTATVLTAYLSIYMLCSDRKNRVVFIDVVWTGERKINYVNNADAKSTTKRKQKKKKTSV